MITLNQWLNSIQEMIKKNPKIGDYPLIYSSDDEGNDFHKVSADPTLAQVEDTNQWSLEIVGFLGDDTIADEDCNVVCIN